MQGVEGERAVEGSGGVVADSIYGHDGGLVNIHNLIRQMV